MSLKQVLRRCQPAVVLLDLMMPGMDGFELLEAMRHEPALRDIPVVVITAKDLTREEVAWLNRRATEVIQKGAYSRAKLAGTIHDMIVQRTAPFQGQALLRGSQDAQDPAGSRTAS